MMYKEQGIQTGRFSLYLSSLITVICALLLTGCQSTLSDPQEIIDRAIDVHGGEKFSNSIIEFDFRDRRYVAIRKGGIFSYQRIFTAGSDTIHDYLTNEGFYREINNQRVDVIDSMAAKYTRSVNSTIYFALLPYGLNDQAVKKTFLGTTVLDGQPYYKVEVSFEQDGGGEDYNDVFHYWIHEQKFTMDYFSYVYFTDGGGVRFRKAAKQHTVNGVTLQDYVNYQPSSQQTPLDSLEQLFKTDKLQKLSTIELRNVKVKTD